MNHLRPSNLPKLALCGHFRPDTAGEAARRGTRLDSVFRALIQHQNVDTTGLAAEERDAIVWAVDTVRILAGGADLISEESRLRIECLGMTGTADLLCPEGAWSADLKTGQRHRYLEQQAAYALGFMDSHFVPEWTVYLLYSDLREVDTLRFTREEAEGIVRGAVANARGDTPPAINDFCGWCSRRFGCPARREELAIVQCSSLPPAMHDAPSRLLREFILRAATVEEYAGHARDLLKSRLIAGEEVDGVSLFSRRGSRRVDAADLAPVAQAKGADTVLAALGTVSEAKARALWDGVSTPFPDALVQEAPGSTSIRVGRARAGSLRGSASITP